MGRKGFFSSLFVWIGSGKLKVWKSESVKILEESKKKVEGV